MVTLTVGTVVLVPFPFSDLSNSKLRPAVVLADAGRGDFVLCQITSKSYGDDRSIVINEDGFSTGSLRLTSYARPGKLFTANENIATATVGKLTNPVFNNIVDAIISMLKKNIS